MTTTIDLTADAAQSATEQLLEGSWEARDRRASQRELAVDTTAALGFALAAAALLLAGGLHGLRPGVAALLVGIYALVGRIEFPVGTGYVVPTQLILVPMLLMLPAAAVPPAVAAGLALGTAVDCALHRVPPRRLLSAIPDAWHALGAAIVLLLAGRPTLGFHELPVIAAAFGAACLFDLGSSMIRQRAAGLVADLRVQIRVIALVWAVDASLAPIGFLAALVNRHHTLSILFTLPLVFLLWLLARDRSHRIDQAHRRLKLVEQERARLQSAVRRLGDAFAAKLELGGLLNILLQGSLEALDADAARLELADTRAPMRLAAGDEHHLRALAAQAGAGDGPVQVGRDGTWTLTVPMRIPAAPAHVTGALHFVRTRRAFTEDEVALITELVAKAELSAAEIIAHHAIREQAMTDALTGLGNRRKLSAELGAAFATDATEPTGATGNHHEPSLLLLFDLNGFKDYNDTFGHVAGDALLARLGRKLKQAVGECGSAYRLGGDEFCAHLRLGDSDPDELIRAAAAAMSERGSEFTIQASVGVVLLPDEADSAEHALQVADQRMYANKRSRPTAVRSQASEVLLRTLHAKQPELNEHSSNVAALAGRVGRRLGLNAETLEEVSRAAELHDIGKVGIPDAILNKPSRLSAGEWEFIHQHTILGERILHGAPALRPVARLVRSSHERWDGTGYPDRLAGRQIPLGARIVSVCDAYEAMTADRSYRGAVSHRAACAELRRSAGSQFDPAVVDAFIDAVDPAHDGDTGGADHAAAHVRTLLAAAR